MNQGKTVIMQPAEDKKAQLKKAYEIANQNEGQQEAVLDWEVVIGDGLEEDEDAS